MTKSNRVLALFLCMVMIASIIPLQVLAVEAGEQTEKQLPEPFVENYIPYCNSDVETYSPDYCFYVTEDAPGCFMMGYEYYPFETECREYLTRENVNQIAYFSGMLYYSVSDKNEIKQIDLSTSETKTVVTAEYNISRFAVSEDGLFYLSNNTIYYYEQKSDIQQALITEPIIQRFWLADDNTLEYIASDDETIIVFSLGTKTTAEKANSISELNLDEVTTTGTGKRGITIESLKTKFPHGKYWNHVGGNNNPDGYTSSPCTCHGSGCSYYGDCDCNSFSNAIQCFGYALKVAYDYYDSNPRYWSAVYNLDSLKAGDYIRYKRDSDHPSGRHSIWVTAVNGDTITYTDCNSTGRCQIRWEGTISKSTVLSSLAYVWSAPTPSSVDNVSASTDSKMYSVGDTVTFSFNALGANSVHLYIYHDGEKFFEGQFSPDATYQRTLPFTGHFSYYVVGHYSSGDVESDWDDFDVVEAPTVSSDARNYTVGSTATFSFSAPGANSVHLYIYYAGDKFFEGQYAPNATYQRALTGAGHYAYYMVAHYDTGDIRTGWSDFQAVVTPTVSSDKETYALGETATFSFEAPLATSVHLYIYKDGQKCFEGQYAPGATYQRSLTATGSYSYYIIGHYPMGDVESEHKVFAVVKPTVSSDKEIYTLGETAVFSFDAPLATSVHLYIYKDDQKYFEGQYSSDGTYQRKLTAEGDYSYYIIGHYSTGDIESEHKTFSVSCEHSYTYAVTTAPTTSATGVLTGTCSNCNSTTTVTLPKLDTTNYNYTVVAAATCTANGTGRYTWKTTTYGTFTFDVSIPKTSHSYTYAVTTAPTTSAAGVLTGTCSKCGGTITVTLPKLDTTNYNYTEVTAATCTANGTGRYTWKTTTYGTFTFDVTNPKTSHSYTYAVTTAPTTSAAGVLTGACSKCGGTTAVALPKLDTTNYTYTVVTAATCTANGTGRYTWKTTTYGTFTFDVTIPKTGHSYTYAVTTAPTTSAAGVLTGTCSKCSGTTTVTLPKLDTTNYNYAVVTAATCTANGTGRYTWKTTTYGTFTFDVTIPKTGHSYTYAVTTAPTTSATGVLTGTCSKCGGTTTITLSKLNSTDYTYAVVTAATCTANGTGRYTWKTTTYGTFTFDVAIPKTGHSYTYAVPTVPTTSATGVLTGTCSKCGGTTTVALPKLDTTNYTYTVVTAATCTANGIGRYTWKTTTYGTFTFDVSIPKTNHSYTYAVTKAPTTSATGTLTGTCTNCGCTTTVTLPKLNTTDYTYAVVTAATCTANGTGRYTWKTATYGTFSFDVTIARTAHSYVDTVTAPTCTEQGYTTHMCSVCGNTYNDTYIAALGHKPGTAVEENRVSPTCTENGGFDTVTYCTICGAELSRVHTNLSALGHIWDDGVIDPSPSCTADGVKTYTCQRCGETKTEAIAATGHTAGESAKENEVAATCTTAGGYDMVIRCTVCNAILYTEHFEIAALIHDYQAVVTAPTCTEGGYTTYICSRCGDSYVAGETAALGHDWNEPEYVWADDYSTVTATRTCKNDANHVETETVNTTSEVTKEATYEEEGEITYTALFENVAFATQTKTVATPKLDGPKPYEPCNGGEDCPGRIFTDMPAKGNWAHDAIDWAIVNKITAGTSATTFSPNAGCTRAQVVTFLWRAAGEPEPTANNNPFTDVKEGTFYYKAVLWAVENKVTAGTSATTFSPDATCTRAQIVTFLWRFEGEPASATTNNPFTDVKAGAYYEKAVLWASETGVTAGTSATTFSPDATCTRAQVVTFLYRDMVK